MKKGSVLKLIIIGILVWLPSWQRPQAKTKKKSMNCSAEIAKAISKYENRKWSYVEDICSEIKIQCSGHSVIDTALYYLGKSLIKMKRYQEAKTEFRRLISDFPNSAFEQEAQFLIGYASFLASNPADRDQEQTLGAIRELKNFLDIYPEGALADSARFYINKATEKLAQKEYATALFYEKLKKNEAAAIYYRSFLQKYPQSELVASAKLHLAMVLAELNQTNDACKVLDDLLISTTQKDILDKAKQLRSKLRLCS